MITVDSNYKRPLNRAIEILLKSWELGDLSVWVGIFSNILDFFE